MLKKILLANAIALAFALPSQAAEIPQSATLTYGGTMGIPATMTFNRNGDNYKVVANINVPLYKIRFESGGKIVGNNLVPSYYNDTRNGKLYAYSKFSNSRVTYGLAGENYHEPIPAGNVMDLFTLSWQMAFNEGKLPNNMHITNGKKISRLGAFTPAGSKQVKIAGNTTTVNQFTAHRGDGNVFYGFAPALNNLPALIGYNDSDDGKKYTLTLKSAIINGKSVKP